MEGVAMLSQNSRTQGQRSDKLEDFIAHEIHGGAREHTIAARTALDAFRHQQREVALNWSSFDTAVGLLDQTIEELRQPVRDLQPTLLVAGGFPAAMAYLIEEIQAADGPDMEFCQHAIETDVPPKWKRAAIRITQESLANACRHSKNKRLFLELALDGNVLRIHARDWGAGFKPDRRASDRFGLSRTCRPLKLLGGTAMIDTEPEKGTYVTAEIPLVQREDAHRRGQFRRSPRTRFGVE
jgi:signal transduction histidine kinase